MVDFSESRLEALITILDYSLHDRLEDTFKECNIPLTIVTPGQGSAKSVIYEILGYGGPRKIVALSLLTNHMANHVMEQLDKNLDLSKPGTGIACTVSLSSVTSTVSTLLQEADENMEMGSEDMSVAPKEQYHLIVSVVNTGHFDQVMDAAKRAGATGGTLVHARGLGSKEAIKYLGITIQPEKDLVLIVAPQKQKRAIMEAITGEVGLTTAGKGICFSLPVNNIIGLGTNLEKIEEASK
ncbi:MAG: P-II family nitrogen regulator [Firmicutes bacterium]|nr:P-II family nitrogen regulator [Bacillota bacterium]